MLIGLDFAAPYSNHPTPVNGKKTSTSFSTSLKGISALVITLSS